MNRREALKAAGTSILTGATLSGTASAANSGPRIVNVESERTSGSELSVEDYDTREYTVTYTGDGTVEITGTINYSEDCFPEADAEVISGETADIVRVSVESRELCLHVAVQLNYTIELEYESEDAVNDVLVQLPDDIGW